MTTNAKLYVTVFLTFGVCVLSIAFSEWRPADSIRFASYLAFAVLVSALKVTMPALAGSMTFTFLLVLIGIADLSLPETLLMGLASGLIENVWRRSRLAPLQVFFNLATMAVAIYAVHTTFHSSVMSGAHSLVRHGVAGTLFFLMNTFPYSAVISLSEGISLIHTWRRSYWWSLPYYFAGALLAWAFHGVEEVAGWPTALLLIPLAFLVYRVYCIHVDRIEDARLHAEELANLHLRTIESLALAIEAKDDTTHEHLKRVQVYAVEIGREMGLSSGELEALRAAAVLHDIGKLAVPEHIISKPGRLTPEEFEKMKIHPVVGAEILEHVQFPYPVVPIVRSHHEKWNGTGYPQGLRGEDIPIGARILSAVDALDALASDRQYRRALPIGDAMAKIEIESGRSFDPRVVEILKRKYVELERKAKDYAKSTGTVKLSTGLKIERGSEPAAGLEAARPVLPQKEQGTHANFFDAVAAARGEIQALFESSSANPQPHSLEETLAVFSVRLKRAISFESMALYLVREDKLVPEYVTGDNYKLFSSLQIPMGQGLSGWVAENRKPILNGNPSVEPGYLNDPNIFSTLRSALAVPLEATYGVIGVLALYHEGRDVFTRDDMRLLQAIAPKLALSIEHVSMTAARVEVTAMDAVTGLPSGRALLPRLEQEIGRSRRLNTSLGVLVCSVGGWAELLHSLGAVEVAKITRHISMTLRDSIGEFDFLARSAPNEFVVLLPGLRAEAVGARADRIRRITIPGGRAVTVQVGEAMFPEDGMDPETLLAKADRRLFLSRSQAESRIDSQGEWVQ